MGHKTTSDGRCPDDPLSSRIGECWPGTTYLVIVADEGMSLELENMLNQRRGVS